MPLKYCLPIINKDKNNIIKTIRLNRAGYDFFEVWLDYISGLDAVFIETLEKLAKRKLIFLFRRKNLEPIKLSLEKRLAIISQLKNSASFIDLDISSQRGELDYIKANRLSIKTIISYHNYQTTPPDAKLKTIIRAINAYRPAILKIAALCASHNDALRLLQLQLDLKNNQTKHIIIGMGKFGVITRIFGSLWGNEIIFAPQKASAQSAAGQFTKEKLEAILNNLKV